jgi:hypothetical protein
LNLVCSYTPLPPPPGAPTEAPQGSGPTKTPDLLEKKLPELFKFNLMEVILAVFSLIVTIIALANSICLIYMNKYKVFVGQNGDENDDEVLARELTLTPILKVNSTKTKKVVFSESRAPLLELKDITKSPSITTLPSPKPFHY